MIAHFPGFMEKRALVLALALTLPLALYGIPYAYAAQSSSSYVVIEHDATLVPVARAHCDTGDYATGGGGRPDNPFDHIVTSEPLFFDGTTYSIVSTGQQPNAWGVLTDHPGITSEVVCQKPIPLVAGISIPEFGSLYVAIALGAVIYFALSRQHAGKRTAQATRRV